MRLASALMFLAIPMGFVGTLLSIGLWPGNHLASQLLGGLFAFTTLMVGVTRMINCLESDLRRRRE